ncbi:MAG TPA: nitrate reductase molybdenum cofactor assembly chaperone [Alcaligenaceae bacterium]|nr:nitrate reductase molybdenum cofactor assembly chaperone [Alcaligenaceae bacterium]
MLLYKILSVLMDYPQKGLIQALPEIRQHLTTVPEAKQELADLLDYLEQNRLIALQENYVATFDRMPSHSLHLFEHIHGESRDRGQAMVDLIEEYKRHGFEVISAELPDYIPLFLEFLSQLPETEALALLNEAIHIMAAIGQSLEQSQSLYASLFVVLRQVATVEPVELEIAPVRDMDEAMERFGVNEEGTEPLLHGQFGEQAVRFYPKRKEQMSGEQP